MGQKTHNLTVACHLDEYRVTLTQTHWKLIQAIFNIRFDQSEGGIRPPNRKYKPSLLATSNILLVSIIMWFACSNSLTYNWNEDFVRW